MSTELDLVRIRHRSDRYLARPTATLAMGSASDVPALLTEVERLRTEVATLTIERDNLMATNDYLTRSAHDAKALAALVGKDTGGAR